MTGILEQAARIGNGQMRVQAFADQRPDRVVWVGKQWEWAALRYENGDFYADGCGRGRPGKWFYQVGVTAMFRRSVGAGSCTGWACETARAPIWTGAGPTSWRCPNPCPPSCSGQ